MGQRTAGSATQSESDDMRCLAVSYMGWPLHFIASLLWRMMSEFLAFLRRTKNRHAGPKASSGHRNTLQSPAVTAPPAQPLVRLKNLPQSEEYFTNKRGRVIHVRSYCSTDVHSIRAVVLFCHGYGSHCNSPRKIQMGSAMPAQGLCMYQMDLEGHGYSGGERAYLEDYRDWVDDYRQLMELVAGDGSDTPHFFTATSAQRRRLREVPIFIAGESLGGALSILLGVSLHETNHPLLPRFKGEVLLAPAIKGNVPPAMLVSILRHLVVPLIPKWQIPSCLESVNRPEMCVLELDERRHANHDVLGYPGGLGWGGNMRFRTGLNLIDLTAEVSRRLEHVKFPFLIMHDPGDGIVHFDSSRELAYRASTPHGSPRGRELRPMAGWLHCLLTNCPELAIQHLTDWVLYQTQVCDEESGSAGGGDRRRRGATRKTITTSCASVPLSHSACSCNSSTYDAVSVDAVKGGSAAVRVSMVDAQSSSGSSSSSSGKTVTTLCTSVPLSHAAAGGSNSSCNSSPYDAAVPIDTVKRGSAAGRISMVDSQSSSGNSNSSSDSSSNSGSGGSSSGGGCPHRSGGFNDSKQVPPFVGAGVGGGDGGATDTTAELGCVLDIGGFRTITATASTTGSDSRGAVSNPRVFQGASQAAGEAPAEPVKHGKEAVAARILGGGVVAPLQEDCRDEQEGEEEEAVHVLKGMGPGRGGLEGDLRIDSPSSAAATLIASGDLSGAPPSLGLPPPSVVATPASSRRFLRKPGDVS